MKTKYINKFWCGFSGASNRYYLFQGKAKCAIYLHNWNILELVNIGLVALLWDQAIIASVTGISFGIVSMLQNFDLCKNGVLTSQANAKKFTMVS